MGNATYVTDDAGVLVGHCPEHGTFIGDAIGCPMCFMRDEEASIIREGAV